MINCPNRQPDYQQRGDGDKHRHPGRTKSRVDAIARMHRGENMQQRLASDHHSQGNRDQKEQRADAPRDDHSVGNEDDWHRREPRAAL